MQPVHKNRKAKAPLFVKEIILPEKEKPGPSHNLINVHSLMSSDSKKMKETTEKPAGGCLKIGSHEVKPVAELVSLEKKVQEPYFGGTRQEKQIRKKTKQQREPHSLNELLFKKSQEESKGLKIQSQSEESLSLKDIIQRRNFQQKIQSYEKMKEHSDRNNYMKQRLAEEKYIQQQENLAETWLGFIKRRNQLKQDGLFNLKPPERATYNDRITISVISRKFWNDEQVEPPLEKVDKKREEKPKQVVDDDSEVGLLKKLVLADDETTHGLKRRYHSRYFRQIKP